jgi:ABC-2 type transport system ATP-binding protein
LTTHYLEEAEVADKICVINHGKIIKEGSPEQIKRELIKDYLIVEPVKKEVLIAELKRKRIKFEDGEEFRVFIASREIQKFIAGLKSELKSIRTHSPSLEEAYLEIIGEKKKEE